MVKTDKELVDCVVRARSIVNEVYKNDSRFKDAKQQQPGSGLVRETDIVFKEILRHLLNN